MNEQEVPISLELLEKVLSSVTPDAVLVGGQALALWVSQYDIDISFSSLIGAISNDADFLGNRRDVASIAKNVSGKTKYPTEREMTALVGQVKINVTPLEFVNVDIIHKVVGIPASDVRRRASEAILGSTRFYVMHPLDVLLSRVENLSQLASKRNDEGIEQARIALLVAREYIVQLTDEKDGDRHALKAIEQVVTIAKSSAGKNVSKNYGISFFGAIPKHQIKNELFQSVRWPRLFHELNKASDIRDVGTLNISNYSDLVDFLENGAYQVQVPNLKAGNYIGKVIWADEIQAVQSLGRDNVVIHNISNWPNKPEVNDVSRTIQYNSGIPDIKPIPNVEKVSSFSR